MATATVTLRLTTTEFRIVCSALRDYYHVCGKIAVGNDVGIPSRVKDLDSRGAAQEGERVRVLREKIAPG